MMNFLKALSFKTILFRAYLTFLALLAVYALAGIVHFKLLYNNLDQPKAAFLIKEPQDKTKPAITVIKFLDYSCQYCKQINPIVEELLTIRKDIRYIVRPVAFDEEISEPILRHVLAAGLQGKFWEMHKAALEYPEDIVPIEFFEQTASLYGQYVEKLLKDAQSKEVDKIMEDNIKNLLHAGVPATPSFLIGSKIYSPSNSMPTLVDLIKMVKEGE